MTLNGILYHLPVPFCLCFSKHVCPKCVKKARCVIQTYLSAMRTGVSGRSARELCKQNDSVKVPVSDVMKLKRKVARHMPSEFIWYRRRRVIEGKTKRFWQIIQQKNEKKKNQGQTTNSGMLAARTFSRIHKLMKLLPGSLRTIFSVIALLNK